MFLLNSTVSIDKFVPHIVANTFDENGGNSLPENVAQSYIRNSAISFAEKTGMITETIEVPIQCGMTCYPIESRNCETIIGVKSAKLENFESLDCGCNWSWGNVDFTFDDDQLYINPAPTKDDNQVIVLEVIVIPNRDACEVNSQFYDKWFDAIINGALAEIHMMPNRPWSSVSRAEYRRKLFNEDVSRATIRKVLQGKREPLKMRPNYDWTKRRNSQRRW